MRENRTYGSEGGEPVMGNSPTPISVHSRSISSHPNLQIGITCHGGRISL